MQSRQVRILYSTNSGQANARNKPRPSSLPSYCQVRPATRPVRYHVAGRVAMVSSTASTGHASACRHACRRTVGRHVLTIPHRIALRHANAACRVRVMQARSITRRSRSSGPRPRSTRAHSWTEYAGRCMPPCGSSRFGCLLSTCSVVQYTNLTWSTKRCLICARS